MIYGNSLSGLRRSLPCSPPVLSNARLNCRSARAVARAIPLPCSTLRNDETVTTEVCAFNYFSVFLGTIRMGMLKSGLFDGAGRPAGCFHRSSAVQLDSSNCGPRSRVRTDFGDGGDGADPKRGDQARPGRKVTTGYCARYLLAARSDHAVARARACVAAAPFPTSAWMQSISHTLAQRVRRGAGELSAWHPKARRLGRHDSWLWTAGPSMNARCRRFHR